MRQGEARRRRRRTGKTQIVDEETAAVELFKREES